MSEELVKALKTIQEECNNHQDCRECPIRERYCVEDAKSWCYLRNHNPISWQFKGEMPPEPPRIFGN